MTTTLLPSSFSGVSGGRRQRGKTQHGTDDP